MKHKHETLKKKNQHLNKEMAERLRAESALRDSESTFRALVENINCGLAIYEAVENGKDFIFHDMNRMGEIITALNREALFGKKITEMFPGVKKFGLFEKLQRVWQTGIPAYHPTEKYEDNRISSWYQNYVFKLPSGEIIVAFTDETARKQTEESLRESEERFRLLVKNVIFGICIIKDDHIVFVSPELGKSNGESFDSFESTHFTSADLKKIKQFYKKILCTGVSNDGLEVRFFQNGEAKNEENVKWVQCKGSVINHGNGKGIMLAMVDVTKVKEMEKVMQLREKMASLGHVAAGIAHEIRNPLSGINVLMEGISENFEIPENAQDIHMLIGEVQKATNKIESIIKRVLDFAKPGQPHLKKADINKPVREAIELSKTVLGKASVSIESDLASNLPYLYIDSHLMEEVMLNLIHNAAEAMRLTVDEKRIKVISWRTDSDIRISVIDTGPGVPEKMQTKIFDPFYTTKADGSGIGLSLCQRVITDHNGTLSLFSRKSGGAIFRIKLPIEKRVLTR